MSDSDESSTLIDRVLTKLTVSSRDQYLSSKCSRVSASFLLAPPVPPLNISVMKSEDDAALPLSMDVYAPSSMHNPKPEDDAESLVAVADVQSTLVCI